MEFIVGSTRRMTHRAEEALCLGQKEFNRWQGAKKFVDGDWPVVKA